MEHEALDHLTQESINEIAKKHGVQSSPPASKDEVIRRILEACPNREVTMGNGSCLPFAYQVRRDRSLFGAETACQTAFYPPMMTNWLVEKTALQIEGYFPKLANPSYLKTLLTADQNCPTVIHFKKYIRQWTNNERNLASLDEIARVTTDRSEGLPYFWPDGWETMKPHQLLRWLCSAAMERLKRSQVEHHYDHLLDLSDKGDLSVVRSNVQLAEIGTLMKNCAAMYHRDIKQAEVIMVVMGTGTDKRKPYALGMIRYTETRVRSSLSQVYLSCNQVPPKEVMDA